MSFLFNQSAYKPPSSTRGNNSTIDPSYPPNATYSFECEYYDPQAEIIRKYTLIYFLTDNTIELYDKSHHRVFLKRCSYPSVELSDLYIGSQVTIYARQLKLTDYADQFTRSKLATIKGRSLLLIKPGNNRGKSSSTAIESVGTILNTLHAADLRVSRLKSAQLTIQQSQQFYGENNKSSARVEELASGPIIAIEVIGNNISTQLQELFNNNNSNNNGSNNNVYLGSSERSTDSELEFFFNNPAIASTARLTNCTLLLIKPHAVSSGLSGEILNQLIANSNNNSAYQLTAIESFNLDRQSAEEFLEIYKTVIPEYHAAVEQLTAGTCIAVEISSNNNNNNNNTNIVDLIRSYVGPSDPEIAKTLRPQSLRAHYGINKVKNAIHCTDLSEDGILESEFFFGILSKQSK